MSKKVNEKLISKPESKSRRKAKKIRKQKPKPSPAGVEAQLHHDHLLPLLMPGEMLATAVPLERFPVVDVGLTSFAAVPPLDTLDPAMVPAALAHIATAAAAVGRIEAFNASTKYYGTGFVVGPDLVATNCHVAKVIATGDGVSGLALKGRPCINFRARPSDPARRCRIVRPLLIHPYWDFALFETEPLPAGVSALTLATTPAESAAGRPVVVIGYPDDPGQDVPDLVKQEVFGGVFGVKRVQPGLLRALAPRSDNRGITTSTLEHSASTSVGNSGSPVLDLESGLVVGIHFGGEQDATNWSIPACDLCRDAHLASIPGIVFDASPVHDPAGPWVAFWNALGGSG